MLWRDDSVWTPGRTALLQHRNIFRVRQQVAEGDGRC